MKIIGIDDGENIKKINKKKIMIVSIIAIVLLALLVIFITYCTNKQFRDIMDKYVLMKNVIEVKNLVKEYKELKAKRAK